MRSKTADAIHLGKDGGRQIEPGDHGAVSGDQESFGAGIRGHRPLGGHVAVTAQVLPQRQPYEIPARVVDPHAPAALPTTRTWVESLSGS